MHAPMYWIINSSSFLGGDINIQNTFTTQRNLHDACDTAVCQSVLCYKVVFVDTVCTFTAVPLLPRRFTRFGRHQIPRSVCLTESRRSACTADVEARDAHFAIICYSLRFPTVVCKTRAFKLENPNQNFDTRFWNAQPSTHKQRWSMIPDTLADIPYALAAMSCQICGGCGLSCFGQWRRSNMGAGSGHIIFLPSRARR